MAHHHLPRKSVPTADYHPVSNFQGTIHDLTYDNIFTHSGSSAGEKQHLNGRVRSRQQEQIHGSSLHEAQSEKLVKWGVHWKTPTFMVALFLAGVGFALGHHFYYASLDGTGAGSSSRQQWATRIGTGFSFIMIAVLKTASDAAYNQYIWTLVRRRAFQLSVLDKMFSLTTNPQAFFSLSLLKHATLGVSLALIGWLIALAGVTPPATLSVVPGLLNETVSTSLATLNWSSQAFFNNFTLVTPSFDVLALSTLVGQGMAIAPLTPPAPNTSFTLDFYGPSLSCSTANSSQKSAFDYYTYAIGAGANSVGKYPTFTKSTFETANVTLNFTGEHAGPYMNVFSAFAPYEGSQGWFNFRTAITAGNEPESPLGGGATDQYNNWDVDFPFSDPIETTFGPIMVFSQQLWVLTATEQHVCILGNASYAADLEFVNGVQTKAEYTTSNFEPLSISEPQGITAGYTLSAETLSYMSLFISLTSMVSGNVTLGTTPPYYTLPYDKIVDMQFYDTSSRSLLTGLSACDDFTKSWFLDNPIAIGGNESTSRMTPVFWNDTSNDRHDLPLLKTHELFEKPEWMCRNRTIARALEDLMGNITMSMLSSKDLTTPNATLTPVLYSTTRLVYQYDSRNLILSYSIALFFSLFALLVGFWSFYDNGVAHSSAFSAIVATTRNTKLDMLSTGHSLGALPLATEMRDINLRFGELVEGERDIMDDRQTARHIGFGLESDVLELRKNRGRYF